MAALLWWVNLDQQYNQKMGSEKRPSLIGGIDTYTLSRAAKLTEKAWEW